MPKFEEAKAEFEEFYGPADFRSVEKDHLSLNLLSQLLEDKKAEQPATSGVDYYTECMKSFFHSYIDRKIVRTNEYFDYEGASGFDFAQFATKFEAMMQAKYELENKNGKAREPYEGKREEIFNKVKESLSVYNKSLKDIWAEQIVSDKLSLDDMKSVLDKELASLNDYKKKLKENLGEAQQIEDGQAKSFVNVKMAHEALNKAWKERGIGWRFAHPVDAIRMYFYKNKLEKTVNTMKDKGVIPDEQQDVFDSLPESILEPLYSKIDYASKKIGWDLNGAPSEEEIKNVAETLLYEPSETKKNELDNNTRMRVDANKLDMDVNGKASELKSFSEAAIESPSLTKSMD